MARLFKLGFLHSLARLEVMGFFVSVARFQKMVSSFLMARFQTLGFLVFMARFYLLVFFATVTQLERLERFELSPPGGNPECAASYTIAAFGGGAGQRSRVQTPPFGFEPVDPFTPIVKGEEAYETSITSSRIAISQPTHLAFPYKIIISSRLSSFTHNTRPFFYTTPPIFQHRQHNNQLFDDILLYPTILAP